MRKRAAKPKSTGIAAGSGNVFADLGVTDASVALAKAELARQIGRIIVARGLTQARAAEVLGADQGKVSALLRGRLAGFSTDRLLRYLNALGRDIEIVIRKRARSRKASQVAVLAADD